MITATYNDVVVDHFDHPRNPAAGSGDDQMSASTGDLYLCGEGGRADSGIWIQFRLNMVQRQVKSAQFRAYGCPHTVALASWLTDRLVGETLDDGYTLDKQEIVALLDLPTEKMRSILVAEDALRACSAKLDFKEY